MDKGIIYIVSIITCLLLQLGLAPEIAIGGVSPNILLIPVLLVAMRSGAVAGSIAGFSLGLVEDFAGDGVVGCTALTFVLVALLVGVVASNMESSAPLMTCIFAVCGAFLTEVIYAIVVILANVHTTGVIATAFGYALPAVVYTAILACIGLVTMNMLIADDGPQRTSGGYSMPVRFK